MMMTISTSVMRVETNRVSILMMTTPWMMIMKKMKMEEEEISRYWRIVMTTQE